MPLLFLNELSCGRDDCDPLRADRAMTEFARTTRALARTDPGTVLVSEVKLKHLSIADGYPIQKWIGNPRNRDHWLRLRQMQNKAPFRSVFPDGEEPWNVEYRHRGELAQGLGGAHLMGGLGISLPVGTEWDAPVLPLECEQLVERADGTTDTPVTDVEVRHVSAERHLDGHREWLHASRALAAVHTGAQLWEQRGTLFPHLEFLPRVEGELRGLSQVWVGPVRQRLEELETAVSEWDTAARPEGPQWRSWVTGEHEQRRRLCWFTDVDGGEQLFDTHARFTPDEGRLHFRLVPERKAVRIAYVGRKRGI